MGIRTRTVYSIKHARMNIVEQLKPIRAQVAMAVGKGDEVPRGEIPTSSTHGDVKLLITQLAPGPERVAIVLITLLSRVGC